MRFALIGTGFGAVHLAWLRGCPATSVEVIVYRQNLSRATELAERFGVASISADPFAVIESGAVDAISIVTPPGSHEELLRAGLAAGLTVVSDKPLAGDAAAAARLVERARRSGTRTLVTYQWRANPAMRRLRRLVTHGDLGRVFQADLEFHHDFLATPDTAWAWRHARTTAGGGALSDQGIHLIDLLRWLLATEWSVGAARTTIQWTRRGTGTAVIDCETDDVAEVWLADADRTVRARLLVSRVSAGHRTVRVTLCGTAGTARLVADPDDGSADLEVYSTRPDARQSTGQSIRFPAHSMNPYSLFLSDSAEDRNECADFADGLAAQLIHDDALARAGRVSGLTIPV